MFRLRFTIRQVVAVVSIAATVTTGVAAKGCSSDGGGTATSTSSAHPTTTTSAPTDGFVRVTGAMICNNGERPDAVQLVSHVAREFSHSPRHEDNREDFTLQTKPGETFKIKFSCSRGNYESKDLTTSNSGIKLVCRNVNGDCR